MPPEFPKEPSAPPALSPSFMGSQQPSQVALEGTVLIDRDALVGGRRSNPDDDGRSPKVDAQGPPVLAYLQKVYRGLWLVIAMAILAVVYAGVKVARTPATYASTAVIRIEPKSAHIANFAKVQSAAGSYEDLQTSIDVVSSLPVMERVVEHLGLMNESAQSLEPKPSPTLIAKTTGWVRSQLRRLHLFLVPLPENRADVESPEFRLRNRAEALRRSSSVNRGENNFLVNVSYYHSDPQFAAKVANEICHQYIAYIQELDAKPYMRLKQGLQRETNIQRQKLESAQLELSQKFIEDPILSLPNAKELAEARLENALSAKLEAEKKLESIRLRTADGIDKLDPHDPLILEINPQISEYYDQLDTYDLRLGGELVEYGPEWPEVKRIKAEVARLEEIIEEKVSEALDKVARRIADMEAQLQLSNKEFETAKAELSELHKRLEKRGSLERDVEVNQAFFDDLLQTEKAFDVMTSFEPSKVTIIEEAAPIQFPISPNLKKEFVFHGIIGIFLGIGLIFLLDYMDRSVHNSFEIEESAHLPTLGYVPYFKLGKSKADAPRTLFQDPESIHAEAFRFLRTSIMYATPDECKPRVLLVTSSMSQEGKTTTAINLGVTMAQLGVRTLVIDCDVKRPSCHQALGVNRKPGLVDYLTGNVGDIEECFAQTTVERLWLMPTGSISPAAQDLFESEALDHLLEDVRDKFEFVIIDSFPLTVGAGTFVLSAKADAVALVVVPGKTPRDLLVRNINRLRSVNARLIGGIYNFTSSSSEKKTNYGYGYNYKYGTDYAKKKKRHSTDDASPGGGNQSGGDSGART